MPIIGDNYKEASKLLINRYKKLPDANEPEYLGNFDFPTNADGLSDVELDDWLLLLGAWRGYVASKLAEVDSQFSLYEEGFELLLGKKTAILEYEAKKKLLKESLHGKAISEDEELAQFKLEVAELRAERQLLKGKFDFFDKQFEVISRIITRRGQERIRT